MTFFAKKLRCALPSPDGTPPSAPACVLSVILLSRYMRHEGPSRRLAAALADSSDHFPAFNHIPSQIEMVDPSRAP